jgi:polygalacturonase
LTEDHTTSGIRIKSNATRGGLVENLTYKNICMRDVGVPIAISPYYNNQTIEGFVDPGIKGERIPEYKNITLENITDLTPGDVLIAGYDEAHRTQVNLVNVTFGGMTLDKMHLKLADISNGGTNLPLEKAAEGNDVKVTADGKAAAKPYSCEGKFLPMR